MTKRNAGITAAVVALAAAVVAVLAFLNPTHDSAKGTQSDPNVGTSQYPAPKAANPTPPSLAISDPSAIPALSDASAKCPWLGAHQPHPANRPSLQDDGVGAQQFTDMPDTPSADTLKCAIARAKAAGYVVTGNSVKCTEETIELTANGESWKFRPFCMNVSPTGDSTCTVNLVPTDYQGNFIWADQPNFRHQNTLADYVRNLSSFTGC